MHRLLCTPACAAFLAPARRLWRADIAKTLREV
jgi:hypothetical protein